MDDVSGGTPPHRPTRPEDEELYSAIIAGYLRDRIEIEIYPKGVSIKEIGNPEGKEIFFPFDEGGETYDDPEYPDG